MTPEQQHSWVDDLPSDADLEKQYEATCDTCGRGVMIEKTYQLCGPDGVIFFVWCSRRCMYQANLGAIAQQMRPKAP